MVNMKDVARAAGVSQAAVSYAYSQPAKLSENQVRHIMKTADRLGYAGPNIIGSSLRSGGRTGAIGVMLMDTLQYAFTDASTKSLLEGIVRSRRLNALALTLIPLPHGDPARSQDGPRNAGAAHAALRGLVDGAIVHSLPDNHPALLTLRARNMPMVIVDAPALPGVPLVGIRDREAASAQLRHVLELGHQRIGILVERLRPDGQRGRANRSRWTNSPERVVRERIEGYRIAYEEAGYHFDAVPIIEVGAFDPHSAAQAATELINGDHPTAIVATSDAMAIGVFEAAKTLDLDIPTDLSVIGFDDAPEAAPLGLTTIRQPMVEKGEHAAAILFDLIDGNQTSDCMILPTVLITRSSTAAAP
jgi:DNA-binding LacI/PurR family transcriptional regulator